MSDYLFSYYQEQEKSNFLGIKYTGGLNEIIRMRIAKYPYKQVIQKFYEYELRERALLCSDRLRSIPYKNIATPPKLEELAAFNILNSLYRNKSSKNYSEPFPFNHDDNYQTCRARLIEKIRESLTIASVFDYAISNHIFPRFSQPEFLFDPENSDYGSYVLYEVFFPGSIVGPHDETYEYVHEYTRETFVVTSPFSPIIEQAALEIRVQRWFPWSRPNSIAIIGWFSEAPGFSALRSWSMKMKNAGLKKWLLDIESSMRVTNFPYHTRASINGFQSLSVRKRYKYRTRVDLLIDEIPFQCRHAVLKFQGK